MNEEKLVEVILQQGGQTYQEAIAWGLMSNTVGVVLLGCVFLSALIFGLYNLRRGIKTDWDDEDHVAYCVIASTVGLLSSVTCLACVLNLIKVLYYPKVYVLSLL